MKSNLTKKFGKSLLFTGLVVGATSIPVVSDLLTSTPPSVQKNVLLRSQTTVNNWDEFKTASQDPNVSEIVLESDIDLSSVTSLDTIASISNKKIIGNQHKFYNSNLKNDFLIDQTNNVSFEGVLFENVEFFINDLNFSASSKDEDAIFSNVFIRDMNVDDTTITTDGLFVNNIDITYSGTGTDEWVAFSNLGIIENNFTNVQFNDASIFAGSINTAKEDLVSVESLSIVDNNIDNSTISGSNNLNFFASVGSNNINSIGNLLVSNNVVTDSTTIKNLSIYRNKTYNGSFKTDAVILNNDINGSGDVLIADFIPTTSSVKVYVINPNFNEASDPYIFGNAKLSNSNINGISEDYLNDQSSYLSGIESIVSDVFGTQGYLFIKDENANIVGVKLSANPFIDIVNAKVKVSSDEIYEMSLEFQFVYSSFVKSDDFFVIDDAKFSVGSKTFSTTEDVLNVNATTGTYFATFKTKNITVKDIEQKGLTLNAHISDNNGINDNVSVFIDGAFINGDNVDIKSGFHMNTSALIAAIIFTIILIILLIIFIIWWLKRRKAQKELDKISGVEGGYYQYVKNEPVKYPEEVYQHDYDNQFGSYDTNGNYDEQYDNDYNDAYANNDYYDNDYYEGEEQDIVEY